MTRIDYVKLGHIDPVRFLPLLNRKKVRKHLMDHDLFDAGTVKAWLKTKMEVSATHGCKVRAVVVDDQLAGWCGIQLEDGKYELAIVLDDGYWGLGRTIFRDTMAWAKTLGHEVIYIHFLHTRPEYRFLRKIANNVYETTLLGNRFTTYELRVE